ncbi:MAG TPA: hypothetical protein DEB17_08650 [Chlorobaculum sp.]|uniref:Uncharacterized protein n=1 Tax=Chlorobaculum tepidum (strain ATCC 49652 / DSM 12025 / NBRC 103806 / TLS) TaxID=194439 RepID=Q8KEX6_CHLTE|nr:hypothetical protein CT0556 [Chlorobaculum tepidum TLS]HBU24036.1 hypothetical protein [Chlorobaculum sp.]
MQSKNRHNGRASLQVQIKSGFKIKFVFLSLK